MMHTGGITRRLYLPCLNFMLLFRFSKGI